MSLRVFSFGGGVQSTAALVLAAQGEIDYREFVFANVGEDSENPGTLRYVDEHSKPFAAAHGLTIHEIRRQRRDGTPDDLLEYVQRDETGVKIPLFDPGGHPGRRGCTGDFKIQPIARWLKQRGATAADPATSGMGISVDEVQRMRRESGVAHQRLDYPLVRLRLTREECRRIIQRAGLPVPPKSSCWFCPFHTKATWRELRRTDPETFERAAELEDTLSARNVRLGRVPLYLNYAAKPLRELIQDGGQLSLFGDEEGGACETGYCMT
jgi:hypothetical protein